MQDFCYSHIIGSQWSDYSSCEGKLFRSLNVTKPSTFHWPCDTGSIDLFTHLHDFIRNPIEDVKRQLKEENYQTTRKVELPVF